MRSFGTLPRSGDQRHDGEGRFQLLYIDQEASKITDRGDVPCSLGTDRHLLGMSELRWKVSHEIVEGRLLRRHSRQRTAEDRPCETSVIDALPQQLV